MLDVNDRLLAYKLCLRRVKIINLFTCKKSNRFHEFHLVQKQKRENKKQCKKELRHKFYSINKYLKLW